MGCSAARASFLLFHWAGSVAKSWYATSLEHILAFDRTLSLTRSWKNTHGWVPEWWWSRGAWKPTSSAARWITCSKHLIQPFSTEKKYSHQMRVLLFGALSMTKATIWAHVRNKWKKRRWDFHLPKESVFFQRLEDCICHIFASVCSMKLNKIKQTFLWIYCWYHDNEPQWLSTHTIDHRSQPNAIQLPERHNYYLMSMHWVRQKFFISLAYCYVQITKTTGRTYFLPQTLPSSSPPSQLTYP
jgi:hypothetical protein